MAICLVLTKKPVYEPVKHQRSVHNIFLVEGIKWALEDSVYFLALCVGTHLNLVTKQFLFSCVDILKDLVTSCLAELLYIFFFFF